MLKNCLIIIFILLIQSCAVFTDSKNVNREISSSKSKSISHIYLVIGTAYENNPNVNIHDYKNELDTKNTFELGGALTEKNYKDDIELIKNTIKNIIKVDEITLITKDEINKYDNVILINKLIVKPNYEDRLVEQWATISLYTAGLLPAWRNSKITYFSKLYKNGKEIKSFTISESFLTVISIFMLPVSPFYNIKEIDRLKVNVLNNLIGITFQPDINS